MSGRKRRSIQYAVALFVGLSASTALPEQLWLSQGATGQVSESLRLGLHNTSYFEHEEHICNEEAATLRLAMTDRWGATATITFSQDRVEEEIGAEGGEDNGDGLARRLRKTWDFGTRPTESISFDWNRGLGGWCVMDVNRFDFKFREGERDWAVYRNISTLTAPPLPGFPWSPRPYAKQQIYFTGRQGWNGLHRFCEFRWVVGLAVRPVECLGLSCYWQYRTRETLPHEWEQFRIVGIGTSLTF